MVGKKGLVLFWAVVLIAFIPAATYMVLKVTSSSTTSIKHSKAETTNERFQKLASKILSTSTDVDNDTKLEILKEGPLQSIPVTLSAEPPQDAWGNDIIYCTWDFGDLNDDDPSYTTNNVAPPRDDVIASLISGGPSGEITTLCSDIDSSGDDLVWDIYHSDALAYLSGSGGWDDLGPSVVLTDGNDNVSLGGYDADEKLDINGAVQLKTTSTIAQHGVLQQSSDGLGVSTYISGYGSIGLDKETPEHREPIHLSFAVISGGGTLGVDSIGKTIIFSGGSYTINLPHNSGLQPGDELTLQMGSETAASISRRLTGLVTVSGNGSLIDGKSSRIMWSGESARLVWTGGEWNKIGGLSIPMWLERTYAPLSIPGAVTGPSGPYLLQPFDGSASKGSTPFVDSLDYTNSFVHFPRESTYLITYSLKFPSLMGEGGAYSYNLIDPVTGEFYIVGHGGRHSGPTWFFSSRLLDMTTASHFKIGMRQESNTGDRERTSSSGRLNIVERPDW